MKYPVTEIFYSIQGEGHFGGYPMVFIRLAGCSILDCRIRAECDEAPWKAKLGTLTADEIVDQVKALRTIGRVCITGGEPGDHKLTQLVCALRDAGYLIHMETSGTKLLEGIITDWLTVSPKVAGYRQRHGNELKLVVRPEWEHMGDGPWAFIRGASDDTQFFHYYLQPLYGADGKPINLDQVLALVHGNGNNGKWAISEQRHKGTAPPLVTPGC